MSRLEKLLSGVPLSLALSVTSNLKGDSIPKAGRTISLDSIPRQLYKVTFTPGYDTVSWRVRNDWYEIGIERGSPDTLRVHLFSTKLDGSDTLINTLMGPQNLFGEINQRALPTVGLGKGFTINVWRVNGFPVYPIAMRVFKKEGDSTLVGFSLMDTASYYSSFGLVSSFFTPTSEYPFTLYAGDSINLEFCQGTYIGDTSFVLKGSWPAPNVFVEIPTESLYIIENHLEGKIPRLGDVLVVTNSRDPYYVFQLPLIWYRARQNIRISDIEAKVLGNFAKVKAKTSNDVRSEWGARGWLKFFIDGILQDSFRILNLWPGKDTSFEFNTPRLPPGQYLLELIVCCPSDTNPRDDTASVLVTIPPGSFGWGRLQNIPLGQKKKKCKQGTDACVDDYGRVWAVKGGTTEIYRFNPETNSWSSVLPLPEKAKYGGICYLKGGIYYFSNGSLWKKDTTQNGPWVSLLGYTVNGKKPKAGTALIGIGDTIFMIVGGRNKNRNAIVAKYCNGSWIEELLSEALVPKKKFSRGASITNDEYGNIYVSVGKTTELLKRSTDGIWSILTNIPTTKGKFDGSIAYQYGSIYTNEGSNISNFYGFNLGKRKWNQLQSWPLGDGKNPKNCVLVAGKNGEIFGLKGNNTLEFWRYIPHEESSYSGGVNETEIDGNYIIKQPKVDSYVITSGNKGNKYYIFNAIGRKVGELEGDVTNLENLGLKEGVYYLIPANNNKKAKKAVVKK